MPLLVARQWPVLRRASAAAGILCRTRRSYAQPSTPVEKKPIPVRMEHPYGAIIIPASLETWPGNLINHVKVLPWQIALERTFCVFFVTPHYAPLLLDDDAFLENVVHRAYWKATRDASVSTLSIQALCAVVDKLPVVKTYPAETSLEDEVSRRTTDAPTAGTGFEGIAYVILPADASVSSTELSPSDHGVVDFIIAEHSAKEGLCRDTLRLPLANTVFQTGTPTTMVLSNWETHGVKKELKMVSKTKVSHHGIRLVNGESSKRVVSALNIPLIPLTVPRVVEGCMGNIVRRVVDPEGNSMQASAELENVVPRFFKSRGQPAQSTVAWALVVPQELKETIDARTEELLSGLPTETEAVDLKKDEPWEHLWRSDPPVWNTLVSKALSKGARLHRVLSGGGGWGKKAGLLSLDPVPFNEAREPSSEDDFSPMINDPEDFASTLTPVVRDGDSIQFFISPKSDLTTEAKKFDSVDKLRSMKPRDRHLKHINWELGTVPSTVDSIPGDSWQHAPWAGTSIVSFQGSFGALAEGGLTLTQHLQKNANESRSLSTTTVDVPFTRFWAANAAVEEEKGEDPLESPAENESQSSNITQRRSNHKESTLFNAVVSPQQLYSSRFYPQSGHSLGKRHFSSTTPQQQKPNTAITKRTTPSLTSDQALDRLNDMVLDFDYLLLETSWATGTIDQHKPPSPPSLPRNKQKGKKGARKTPVRSLLRLCIPGLSDVLGLQDVNRSGRLSVRTARKMLDSFQKQVDLLSLEVKIVVGVARMGGDARRRRKMAEEETRREEKEERRMQEKKRRAREENRREGQERSVVAAARRRQLASEKENKTVFTVVKESAREAGVRIKKVAGAVKDASPPVTRQNTSREGWRAVVEGGGIAKAAPISIPRTARADSTKDERRGSMWERKVDLESGTVSFAQGKPAVEPMDGHEAERMVEKQRTLRGGKTVKRIRGGTRGHVDEGLSAGDPLQGVSPLNIRKLLARNQPETAEDMSRSLSNESHLTLRKVFRLTEEARRIMATIRQRKSPRLSERPQQSNNPSAASPNLKPDVLQPVRRTVREWSLENVRLQNEVAFIMATVRRRARQALESSRKSTAVTIRKAARAEMKQPAKKEPERVTVAESLPGMVRIRKMRGAERLTLESMEKAARIAASQVYNLSRELSMVMDRICETSQSMGTYIERVTDEYEQLNTELRTQFHVIHGGILLRRDKEYPLLRRFEEIQDEVVTTREELSTMLQRISRDTHITHTVNQSALFVYAQHLQLRILLGRIIRSMFPRRWKLRPQIHRLEAQIFTLREFDDVLLVNIDGLENKDVRKYLERLELGNKHQRNLSVKMEEGRKLRQARNLKRANYGLKVGTGSMIRMTFGSPYRSEGDVGKAVAGREETTDTQASYDEAGIQRRISQRFNTSDIPSLQSPRATHAREELEHASAPVKLPSRRQEKRAQYALKNASNLRAKRARKALLASATKPPPSSQSPPPRAKRTIGIRKYSTPFRRNRILTIRTYDSTSRGRGRTLSTRKYADKSESKDKSDNQVRRTYIMSLEEKKVRRKEQRKEQRKKGKRDFVETLGGWLEGGLGVGGETDGGDKTRRFGEGRDMEKTEDAVVETRDRRDFGEMGGLDSLIETAKGYEGKRKGGR